MNKKIKEIKEITDLKDSVLLYEKDLPNFAYIIIIIISIFLVGIVIWGTNATKTYIVKGQGVVESNNKNYVMPEYSGKIINIYITPGKYVNEGDLLFEIKSLDLNLQQKQIEEQISAYKKQIKQLEKFEKSVKDNVNYFEENALYEKEYYYQFETYRSQDIHSIENERKKSDLYNSTLRNNAEKISMLTSEANRLELQYRTILEGKNAYKVCANTSGIVHMNINYKKGMIVQAGETVCSIANDNDTYTIGGYILASDMPLIKLNDEVDIAVLGLNENIYGTISGLVYYIDNDITFNEKNGKNYFKVMVNPDSKYLINKMGRRVNISNGMTVEVRIKYDEITYFTYLLDALGVLVR